MQIKGIQQLKLFWNKWKLKKDEYGITHCYTITEYSNSNEQPIRSTEEFSDNIAWSPNGEALASGSHDGPIRLWDAHTGIQRYTLSGHQDWPWCIEWSPTGEALASGSRDGTIRLWNTQTGLLQYTIPKQNSHIINVKWSPNGQMLASIFHNGIINGTLKLWESHTGTLLYTFSGLYTDIAWSPDGKVLVVGSRDGNVHLWDVLTGKLRIMSPKHPHFVFAVKWSPNGKILASGSRDGTIYLQNALTGEMYYTLRHSQPIWNITWSPDGRTIVCGSHDGTIRLWDVTTGLETNILEGHTSTVRSVAYSYDGHFLISRSDNNSVRLWRTDTWETVAIINDHFSKQYIVQLAFHPKTLLLVTYGKQLLSSTKDDFKYQNIDKKLSIRTRFRKATLKEKITHVEATKPVSLTFGNNWDVRIWKLNSSILMKRSAVKSSVYYSNAKVVLVGDSSVGKSGLGLVLTGHPFTPTESTHGRHVWTFSNQNMELGSERRGICETILWDMAGQPGYRLIHQLHLNEVVIAIIVFDAHSETDPFAGVQYWNRALWLAERTQNNSSLPMKKFLVAARADRGGVGVSQDRINLLMYQFGIEKFFQTSAKEGWGITELSECIKQAIDWKNLPRVSSTEFFQHIKTFLVEEKKKGQVLSTANDLYQKFLLSNYARKAHMYNEFDTCVGRLEARDLIRRLSFGTLVLLQPEVLDSYASALINAVKEEPDGLGSISEEQVKSVNFFISADERLLNREQEKLLMIAMIEDLLRHEIVLREDSADGPYLVFPSQSTRENPDMPYSKGKAVTFEFEGPVLNIYTTLAVRLSHSGLFMKKDLWKNAVTYTTKIGGLYGIFLYNKGEGQGELTIFFEGGTNEEASFYFDEYIYTHLRQRSLPNTLIRRRVFSCGECGFVITDQLVELTRNRGYSRLNCPVPGCGCLISLLDKEERVREDTIFQIHHMDLLANVQRDRDAAKSVLQGKREIHDFDVFLCYNHEDLSEVKIIGEQLKEQGILPWLDEWELQPGLPWQRTLEQEIKQIKAAAVFIGKKKIGPWTQMEIDAFLRQFIKRECPIIPVILSSAQEVPELPAFLEGVTWVDFHKREPSPVAHLIWGITGKRR